VIVVALVFDYINGFHDAANAIATVVSTGVLPVRTAVILAGILNFIGAITGTAVAKTIASGFAEPMIVTQVVVLAALIGACIWNLLTWWYGIPSSSSHALIGGMIGATISKAGTDPLVAAGIIKTATFIFVSPLLGMALGALLMIAVSWICLRSAPRRVDRWFRRLQLASSAAYSIGHGSNDAQKTMGIIWLLLISAGVTTPDHLPSWVIVSCYVAIAFGTMFGGWRIVKTMGQKITKLRPVGGFAAETGGAITLFLASSMGIPVSTTHTITGAIIGVGSAQRTRAVRWGIAGNIVFAWIVTMPAAALMAALAYYLGRLLI
jgi:PiT family inorganic phosphate transporter